MISAHGEEGLADLSLRRAYNERQLVSQVIRSGVFHDIFSYLADTYPPGRSQKGPFPLGWIYVTHVCASLRYSALETSSLWARHVCAFGAEHVFQVLLERAGSFPITIDNIRDYTLVGSQRRLYNVPEHYIPALARAANINLVANYEQMKQVAHDLCGREAPNLTTLKLRCSHLHINAVQAVPVGALPADSPLDEVASLATHTRLRDVELIGMYIPIAGRNLVSLRIAGLLRDSEPTLDRTLHMLRECVNLESLRLQGFTRNARQDNPAVTDVAQVHLPKLVELVLEGRSSLALATHLTHPPLDVASVIQSGGEETTIGEISTTLSSLLCAESHLSIPSQSKSKVYMLRFYDSFMGPGFGVLLMLCASDSHIGDPHIFGNRAPGDPLGLCYPYAGPGGSEPQLTISVTGLDPVYGTMRGGATFLEELFALQRALSHGLLKSIETLHISIHPARPLDWHTLLLPFTSVHTIVMAYEQPSFAENDGLVDALAEVNAYGTLRLPSLKTIMTDKKVPWRPRDYTRFREMLAFRATHGAPVLDVCSVVSKEKSNALMRKYYDDLVRLPNTTT
ncbi:hypothetical protein PENSPDRAFT_651151 [Peniophora sp. CONT]|nr:hypothetical protein PENSPDRAFT_651151 [Peniophora sp. CONT]